MYQIPQHKLETIRKKSDEMEAALAPLNITKYHETQYEGYSKGKFGDEWVDAPHLFISLSNERGKGVTAEVFEDRIKIVLEGCHIKSFTVKSFTKYYRKTFLQDAKG